MPSRLRVEGLEEDRDPTKTLRGKDQPPNPTLPGGREIQDGARGVCCHSPALSEMKSDGDSIWGIPTYREPSPQKQEPGSWVGISPFGVTVGVASLGVEGKSHILCLCSQMPRLLRRHRRRCAHSMALTLAALLYLGLSVDSTAQGQGGSFPRPVLRAEPCSVVAQGSAVTLWCEGARKAKEFRLQKEHSVQWSTNTLETWGNRTSFFIQSMKKGDAGRYFCVYLSPVGWSDHSEPLELVVTGLESYLQILIGVSVAFLLLLFFLLLFLLWHRSQDKGRKSAETGAGTVESVPGDRGLPGSSSPAAAVQEEILYEDAAAKDTEPKDGVELDSRAASREDPQDVTYAQLCHVALTQQMAAPPAEPSLYASLAARSPKGTKQ
ncbi:PREDICTED: leukocyte immunoglobulin-like receptor subfamily B member 5 isoform X1 [Dipodomys ordii]|uniref:Leukocyte immunoglobulin-like receptor subfamily B member 5 isoform X1 n=1 Tax=Dipodomys ordii TaxID=10020 RepID=A0A1S3G364_DIPOR|nr:PREDICTED: leukocyte immunoglobulin-like receptor subfamily B member 5 isoform X1 [Dipodomys ordii]